MAIALPLYLLLTLGAPPPPAPVELLADGSELIHVETKGGPTASLRVVVRSGGSADPADKAGLAHVLEHLVFHGSYEIGEDRLLDEARKVGANVNAFTTPDYTFYVLDAPLDRFEALAANYLQMITSPALPLADLERERGVIATESMLTPSTSITWVADQLLFPGVQREATLIGTRRTRENIQHRDLSRFFAEHYRPANLSFVVVGDLPRDRVRALLEDNVRLPPSLPDERPKAVRGEPNVPLTEKTAAPFTLTLFGYEVSGMSRPVCRDLASLVELRATLAAQVQRPLASKIETSCMRLRGRDFLLAIAQSLSYEGGQLPEVLEETFIETARSGPSGRERELIRAHASRTLDQQLASPPALADALVKEAALPVDPATPRTLDLVLRAPQLDGAAMTRAAKNSFTPARRVFIHISPFGG